MPCKHSAPTMPLSYELGIGALGSHKSLFTPKTTSPMKPKIIALAAVFAAILLAGCQTSASLNNVHIGMTKAEVQSLLGTPDSTSAQANVEYMTYYLTSEAGYGRDQPYMVRLVNGKVESFGRFAQLFDLYNRPVTNATPGQPDFPQLGISSAVASMAGATAPGGYAPAPKPDLVAELAKLKELKDQGALTDEEFQKAKAKLLAQP
jgi:hypothetical protein